MSNRKIFLTLLLGVILSSFVGFAYGLGLSGLRVQAQTNNQVPASPAGVSAASYEQAVIDAVQKSSPAVVSIVISKDVPVVEQYSSQSLDDIFGSDPFLRQFFEQNGIRFNQPKQQAPKSQEQPKSVRKEIGGGSGFIISADGMIITNRHVVSDPSASYTVFLNDGRKFEAKILARSSNQDLAILKIEGQKLPTLPLGDSDNIKLGQSVIAIGNALAEFRNTVSVGVISGMARTVSAAANGGADVERLEGVLQTDAAINPGNSGGPLLNLKGEVVGINVAVAQGAQNIGFSIPINQVKKAVKDVEQFGKIITPYLGVRYVMIDNALKEKEKLPVNYGALIRGNGPEESAVIVNSPAAKAGIKENDIILQVNGRRITNENTLSKLLSKYTVGDSVKLRLLRDGKNVDVTVKLEQVPQS